MDTATSVRKVEYILWISLLVFLFVKFLNPEWFGSPFFFDILPNTIFPFSTIFGFYLFLYVFLKDHYENLQDVTYYHDSKNKSSAITGTIRVALWKYFGLLFSFQIFSIYFKLYGYDTDLVLKIELAGNLLGVVVLLLFEKDRNAPYYQNLIPRSILISGLTCIFYYFSVYQLIDLEWRHYPESANAIKTYVNSNSRKREREHVRHVIKMEYNKKQEDTFE